MNYIGKIMCLAMLILVSISLPLSSPVNAAEIKALSLDEALDISLKNNSDLEKGKLQLEKAEIARDDSAEAITYVPVEGAFSPEYQALYSGYQQAELTVRNQKKILQSEEARINSEVISTYCSAVKNFNAMHKAQLQLELMDKQNTIASISKEIGLISNYDYEGSKLGKKQLQEVVNLAESSYNGSITELRRLLGQSSDWEVELVSKPTIKIYPRHDLAIEVSRGTSESALVMTKEFLLGLEEIKKGWRTTDYVSRQIQDIDLSLAQIDYGEAKRAVRATIEQLYYTIDALEGQIQAAESALATAQKDLEIAQLKYEVGAISRYSMTGTDSLSAAEVAAETARMDLENLKADLAQMKAQFAYLTGQEPYDPEDWDVVE